MRVRQSLVIAAVVTGSILASFHPAIADSKIGGVTSITIQGKPSAAEPPESAAPGCVVVRTPADLDAIRKNLTGNYCLGRDLDMRGIDFKPIGRLFQGTFDGRGHVIRNLTVVWTKDAAAGLFNTLDYRASIANLGLANVNIQGSCDVGGLAGESFGRISSSWASGSVAGNCSNGGSGVLVGRNRGKIDDSWATGLAVGDLAGGLAGASNGGGTLRVSITRSWATTAVYGGSLAGGLVGMQAGDGTLIADSWAVGPVSMLHGGWAGGLVGWSTGAAITRSWASGPVTNPWYGGAGGLVGSLDFASIDLSYATGPVFGGSSPEGTDTDVGGLVGVATRASIKRSFATGTVASKRVWAKLGGLVGTLSGFSIEESWATGAVVADGEESSVGGLVGSAAGNLKEVFAAGEVKLPPEVL